ncbi:DUF1236 domain-containing protein [Limoniibacter endophyticus]|uniref:DUF1236 domain-containing protein n=1 Tax=Limoniibacter endophyticus TaxID=1565040 RepID=A0A8J3GG02_9HYPH|nr:DUF1236 domain-containing protein [Limoniibacter endophyticus]GHC69862.1 hypothetical protein GCM10010136_16080 [Limoniibacter endophyticus]
MKRRLILFSAAALTIASGAAMAQERELLERGVPVDEPVRVIEREVIVEPRQEIITYVERQPMPERVVVIEAPIAVGAELPRDVELYPIPDEPTYRYAVVNEQRVIVNPNSYEIVRVLD